MFDMHRFCLICKSFYSTYRCLVFFITIIVLLYYIENNAVIYGLLKKSKEICKYHIHTYSLEKNIIINPITLLIHIMEPKRL